MHPRPGPGAAGELERVSLGVLRARCRKLLQARARPGWLGPRALLRRRIRRFLRDPRADRRVLARILAGGVGSSALALALLGLGPPARAAQFFVETAEGQGALVGFDGGDRSTPAFADLDADGDLDAVSGIGGTGPASGFFVFFENTGTVGSPAYIQRTGTQNPLDAFDIGGSAAPAFADLDADGDLDAVSGNSLGGFAFLENTGGAASPAFAQRTGTANPLGGFDVGHRSTPDLADLDGDGDLDIVAGVGFGSFAWLENTGSAATPAFALRTGSQNPLGAFDVGYESAPTLGDLDGDGDLDLVSGERHGTFVYLENTGTAAGPAFALRTGTASPLAGLGAGPGYSTPALADLDGDGDLDLSAGSRLGSFAFLANIGSPLAPAFAASGAGSPLAGFDVGSDAFPAFADLDGDGDPDLLSGRGDGRFTYLENTGSAASAAFRVADNPLAAFTSIFATRPAFADLDADGDFDVLVPGTFFENTGTAASPAFAERTGAQDPLSGFVGLSYSFADLDGDLDLDAVSGGGDGGFQFLENTGTASSPAFAPRTGSQNPLDGFDVGYNASPALADVDGDGDADLLSGSGSVLAYFENTGFAAAPAFVERPGGARHPLAGFAVPFADAAPTLADLDADGDLDAVAGGIYGTFSLFENAGPAPALRFEALDGPSHALSGFSVGGGSSPALGDLDADGDLDLVSGESYGRLFVFENTGSAASPAFRKLSGTGNPLAGLYLGPPALGDLDGDGDLDLVTGDSYYGGLSYVENTGTAASPAFALRTGTLDPLAGLGVGFGPASPALADLDGDGDLDLVAGDDYGTFSFFRNTGSAGAPAFAAVSAHALSGFDVGFGAAPALSDLDGDGDLDGVSGAGDGTFAYLENTGTATAAAFALRTGSANPLAGLGVGSGSSPALADLDADGDLDLVSGESDAGGFLWFENTGTATSPAFGSAGPEGLLRLDAGAAASPVLADLDGDGDPDLLSGRFDGTFLFLENQGSAAVPRFRVAASPLAGFDVGAASTPALADFDADGDLDLLSGESQGTFAWLENTGTASGPAFAQRTGSLNPLDGFDLGLYSAPAAVDLDGDGDLDVVSTAFAFLPTGPSSTFAYFENTGTAASPAFVERTGTANPLVGFDLLFVAAPVFADLDRDGDLDLFAGAQDGRIRYFENTGSAASPAFAERAGGARHPLAGFDVDVNARPTFADLDADGDLDVLAGESGGTFAVFRDTTPRVVAVPVPWWVVLGAALGLSGCARLLSSRPLR